MGKGRARLGGRPVDHECPPPFRPPGVGVLQLQDHLQEAPEEQKVHAVVSNSKHLPIHRIA